MVNIKIIEDKEFVKKFIEDNHYSHKIPQAIKYRFGMFFNDNLMGVAIFSIPSNMYSITSVFNDEKQNIVLELSRFFTFDYTPKNFESNCLSLMLKYIKNNTNFDVVLSYSDENFGHFGYLYQSTNFLYIGKTNPETRYLMPNGELITRRGLGRSKGDTENMHIERLLKDGAKKIKMIGKHKYIYFTCDKRRKKELISKMKVETKQYPKGEFNESESN